MVEKTNAQMKLMDTWEKEGIITRLYNDGFRPRSNLSQTLKFFKSHGVDEGLLDSGLCGLGLGLPQDMPYGLNECLGYPDIGGFMQDINFLDNYGNCICIVYYFPNTVDEENYFFFKCDNYEINERYQGAVRKIKYRVKNANIFKKEDYTQFILTLDGAFEHACTMLNNAFTRIREVIPSGYESLQCSKGGRSEERVYYSSRETKIIRAKYDAYNRDKVILFKFFAEDTKVHSKLEEHFTEAKDAISSYEQVILCNKLKGD